MSGPTTGATEITHAWAQRRVLAAVVRASVFLMPAVVTWGVTAILDPHLYRRSGLPGQALWLAQLAAVGIVAVVLTSRLMRRLLPLATLLNVSLVFPDQVPSRFRVALKGGTVRNLQTQLDAFAGLDAADVQAHAEHLLELVASLSHHERLTRGHTERVRAYAQMIGEEMVLGREERQLLQWSCLVHDIGKLSVPASVLNKAGRPTDEEWDVLRRHPEVGGELVEPLAPWLGEWRLAASQHHERWDGKGYPLGLSGSSISLAGRIVAVADAYDVITSARSYKKPMSPEAARAELVRCSGSQFDPAVVRAFLGASVRKTSVALGLTGWFRELLSLGQTGGAAVTTTVGQVAVGAAVAGSVADGSVSAPPAVADQTAAPAAAEPAAARADGTSTPAVKVTLDPDKRSASAVVTTAAPGSAPAAGAVPDATATTAASDPGGAGGAEPADAGTVERPAAATAWLGGATWPGATTTTDSASSPVVQPDRYTVGRTSFVWLDVLANDVDTDGDLRPKTLWATNGPGQGAVLLDYDESRFVFTIVDGTPGVMSFTYRVCDSAMRCGIGTVTLTIE